MRLSKRPLDPGQVDTKKQRSDNRSESPKDRQFVTALARGLEILRCFDAENTELGSVDLARMTGLPQSTVWRLCYTLVQCGFLVPCERSDKLQIGTPVLSLGYGALATMGFDETLRREMKKLAVDFDAAVSMAAPDGEHMIITQRARGNGVLLVNLQVGSRLPIARSSFGWGYLAALPEKERKKEMSWLLPEGYPDRASLRKNIQLACDDYEKSGYVINCGVFHKNINAIAIPFMDTERKTIKVINCGAPSQVLPPKVMREKVAPRLQELVRTAMAAELAESTSG